MRRGRRRGRGHSAATRTLTEYVQFSVCESTRSLQPKVGAGACALRGAAGETEVRACSVKSRLRTRSTVPLAGVTRKPSFMPLVSRGLQGRIVLGRSSGPFTPAVAGRLLF